MRDEMLRAKVLIFMIPLVLPIGQPTVTASGGDPDQPTPGVVMHAEADGELDAVESRDDVR